MAKVRRRFDCLEAGCDFSVEAASEHELVGAVQAHVSEEHDSFELEEFILAGAVEVADTPPSAGPQPPRPG